MLGDPPHHGQRWNMGSGTTTFLFGVSAPQIPDDTQVCESAMALIEHFCWNRTTWCIINKMCLYWFWTPVIYVYWFWTPGQLVEIWGVLAILLDVSMGREIHQNEQLYGPTFLAFAILPLPRSMPAWKHAVPSRNWQMSISTDMVGRGIREMPSSNQVSPILSQF